MSQNSKTPTYKSCTLWKIRGVKSWADIAKAPNFRSGNLWFKVQIDDNNDPVKLACALSRKYGGAVERNLCKRRIKSVVRGLVKDEKIPKGVSILVGTTKNSNGEITHSEIEKSCNDLALYIKNQQRNILQ